VVVAAAMAAVAPIIPALRPDIEGIIVLEFGAVGLIRVATLTDATRPQRAAAIRRRPDTAVIDVTATAAGSDPAPFHSTAEPESPTPADAAAAVAGGDASGAAARWAGRTAAAAATSGRQAVARHRPEAEERVKRSIRSAGRLAGRLTAPSDPDKTDN
jgi:hypothetical protein